MATEAFLKLDLYGLIYQVLVYLSIFDNCGDSQVTVATNVATRSILLNSADLDGISGVGLD